MRLYSNLTTPAHIYQSFDLNNLNLDKIDPTFRSYAEYLVDNRIISAEDKHHFWHDYLNESTSPTPDNFLRHERNFILPVSLLSLQKDMAKLGGSGFRDASFNFGAISKAPLALILEWHNTPPENLVLLITYSSHHMAHFSGTVTDQSVHFSPKVLVN